MKTESMVKFVLRLALTLLAITTVVAIALAGVNMITEPAIAALNERNIQAAIEAVLPGGGEPVDSFTDSTGLVSRVYASENGYAVEVNPVGFNGAVTMMVGIDKEGNVMAIDVVNQAETAGLGAVIDAETPAGIAFREQFTGMSGSVSVSKDGGEVEAITGATITSRAVCVGVNAALACVENLG